MPKPMILSDDLLEDFIVEIVNAADHNLLFPELTAKIARTFGFDVSGDAAISIGDNPNCIIWVNLNDQVADAIISAAAKGRIHYIPVRPARYRERGIDLTSAGFAVADPENPPPNFNSPTWFPTVLSPKSLMESPMGVCR